MKKSIHTREYAELRRALRSLRENAGLSQRELATKLAVPHSWVAKVEAGERRIDPVEFAWIVSACQGDPAEVFARVCAVFREQRPRRKSAGGPAT